MFLKFNDGRQTNKFKKHRYMKVFDFNIAQKLKMYRHKDSENVCTNAFVHRMKEEFTWNQIKAQNNSGYR